MVSKHDSIKNMVNEDVRPSMQGDCDMYQYVELKSLELGQDKGKLYSPTLFKK